MSKNIIFTAILLFITGFSSNLFGKDLELKVKEFKCTDEGVNVKYTVKNEKTFARPHIRIGFKVLIDDKPVGCDLITTVLPVNPDPEPVMEATINAPCKGKPFELVSTVFDSSIKTYRVDNWMAECPKD